MFSPSSLSFSVPSLVFWVLFLCALLFAIVVTIILFYHWMRYGKSDHGTIAAEVIYAVVLAILVFILFGITSQLS
ncbi:MAG: hypothetical protein AAB587_00575 [Patescibacteria group bacterium]